MNKTLVNFFNVEIRNEEYGGVSPATLGSALDSWRQASNNVLFSWCETVKEEDLDNVAKELMHLVHKYGLKYKLENLLLNCV